jgi:hypothetical protein
MKAPSYDEIYDIEGAIEEACKTVLPLFGVLQPVFAQQDSEELPDERVDVQLRLGGETGHRGIIDKAEGEFARDAWDATLEFTVYTRRTKAGAGGLPERVDKKVHRGAVARVRHACEYFADAFTEQVLPYHVLSSIRTQGVEPQVNVDDEFDASVLTFAVVVSVRTGAWPESESPNSLQ